jgi:flagella basal body P-ring formation protein FlgA
VICRQPFCLLALAAVLAGAPSASVAGEEPRAAVLLANAQVTGEGVFLGQVIEPNPALSLPPIRLGNSPAFGQALTLTRQQIREAWQKAAPELAATNWAGAVRVRVTRRARVLEEVELRQLLTARLQRDYVRDRGELELRLTRPWTAINVPDESLTLRVVDLLGVTPNFIARFELSATQEVVGAWQVAVQANIWREVWAAKSPLPRGQLLREADLVRERRDALVWRDLLPDNWSAEPLMEFAENVAAGTPISNRSVRLRPAVRRGQLVDALVQDGALQVVLKVEVLENGVPGQVVRVRNLQSRREFRGKVQNEQTILVSL